LFGYLAEHSAYIYGEVGWPRGGGLAFSRHIAACYIELGGEIQYRKKVVKFLTASTFGFHPNPIWFGLQSSFDVAK
jgi:hypothetical protein